MSAMKRAALVVAVVVFAAIAATPQTNSGQVIFSKTGGLMNLTGNSKATTTPFGFWIWCNAEAASGSNGGYQLAHACQGAMYFYALSTPATHVVGVAKEGAPGIYTMLVEEGTFAQLSSGTIDPAYHCSLTNVTPGGGDSVSVMCNFPKLGGGFGSATVTGAIVNITGP